VSLFLAKFSQKVKGKLFYRRERKQRGEK